MRNSAASQHFHHFWQFLSGIFAMKKKDRNTVVFPNNLYDVQVIFNHCQIKYASLCADPFDWRTIISLTYLNLAQRMLIQVRDLNDKSAYYCHKLLYDLAVLFSELPEKDHFDEIMFILNELERKVRIFERPIRPKKIVLRPDYQALIDILLDNYDELKQCYVVMRKGIIDETLRKMHVSIQKLQSLLGENRLNKKEIFFHLQQIVFCLECIQFNSNRDSRSSQHLFEVAHFAKENLRKALGKVEIGRLFLNQQ